MTNLDDFKTKYHVQQRDIKREWDSLRKRIEELEEQANQLDQMEEEAKQLGIILDRFSGNVLSRQARQVAIIVEQMICHHVLPTVFTSKERGDLQELLDWLLIRGVIGETKTNNART